MDNGIPNPHGIKGPYGTLGEIPYTIQKKLLFY